MDLVRTTAKAALLLLAMLSTSPALAGRKADCLKHLASAHAGGREMMERSLDQELLVFQALAERALALRAETIKVGTAVLAKADQGKPLSGDDIAIFNQGIKNHLALRKEMLAAAISHECWLDTSNQELEKAGVSGVARFKGVMISLA